MWFRPTKAKHHALRARPVLQLLEARHTPATFVVNTTLDVVSDTDDKRSLREAISEANLRNNALNPGGAPDVIALKSGVYKIALMRTDDANGAGDFDVTESVKIVGKGAYWTAIEGNITPQSADISRPPL
jgi:CSLREA domain-containing protein